MLNKTSIILAQLPLLLLVACGGNQTEPNSSESSVSSSSVSSVVNSSISSSSSVSSVLEATLELNVGGSAPCRYAGITETEHQGHSGSGYWNGDNAAGAGITFAVSNTDTSSTSVTVRYANGGSDSRSATLKLGDQETSLSFPASGGWDQWQEQTAQFTSTGEDLMLSLTALTSAGLANIDSIELSSSTAWQLGSCENVTGNSDSEGGPFLPANNQTDVAPDTFLAIRFDAPPNFSGNGTVTIRRASDNATVDQISVSNDTVQLGYQGQSNRRTLKRSAAIVIGNELRIYPHNDVLAGNTEFTVTIPQGIVSGTVNGRTLTYVDGSDWRFTTRANLSSRSTVSVDDDGASDFKTVQGALNFVMRNNLSNVTINIAAGQYYELLYLNGGNNIRLQGAGKDITRIFQDNADAINSGSSGRPLFLVNNTDLLTLQNLTLHNTHLRSANGGSGAQAETIYFNSSGRMVAKNAEFRSEQDTLLLKGHSWFYQSTIVGNVDYIWGYPVVALFEESEIRSIGDSKSASSTGGGYVVQARVENASYPGIVFLNSRFTRGPGILGNQIGNGKTYLARSGNSANSQSRFDSVSFINCRFDSHVASVGWFDESSNGKYPNPSYGNANYGLREYNSQNLNGQSISPNRHGAFYALSSSDVNNQFKDRQTIFGKVNKAGSWLSE